MVNTAPGAALPWMQRLVSRPSQYLVVSALAPQTQDAPMMENNSLISTRKKVCFHMLAFMYINYEISKAAS